MTADRISRSEARVLAEEEFTRFADLVASLRRCEYNGIDMAAHPFHAEKEDFLIFVGRISPEKRPEVAIEVAREAKLPLVMVIKRSEPAERAYFDAFVAPLLGDDVTVLDQPPDEVKVDLLGRARALVFPIDWPEPFGLVMTEAMACGTPVITRPVGAASEIVSNGVTGFLCSTQRQMVDAVAAVSALRPEDCRARVAQRFSAHAMVVGYAGIYRAALAGDCPLSLRAPLAQSL